MNEPRLPAHYDKRYTLSCAVAKSDTLTLGLMTHHPGLIAIDSHDENDDDSGIDSSFAMTPDTARFLAAKLIELADEITPAPPAPALRRGCGEGEGK